MASQIAIIASWGDARFGTIANVVLLAAVIYGAFAWGPFGLRAEYERLVRDGLARTASSARPQNITEADLAVLPPLVQRYLRFAGVVGTPRVQGFRARMTGRIRGSATAPWMPFVAEQHNFYDPPRRYFWMEATRGGLPLDGLHAYGEADASMRIRLLSLVPVVHVSGPQMMRARRSRCFNDMCIFAPGSLLDPSIRWRELDARSVEATYTNGPHTIRAVLVFDDSGALVELPVRRSPGSRRGRQDHAPAALVHADPRLPGHGALPARRARRGPLRRAERRVRVHRDRGARGEHGARVAHADGPR